MSQILVVDDSASIRQALKIAIGSLGHSVTEACNGQDGVSKASCAHFDLVITDLNMPNLDGIGLIKGARALPSCKFIPIVMLTTESQDSRKQEGKAAGATGWIVKPFKPEQLMAVVKKVLG